MAKSMVDRFIAREKDRLLAEKIRLISHVKMTLVWGVPVPNPARDAWCCGRASVAKAVPTGSAKAASTQGAHRASVNGPEAYRLYSRPPQTARERAVC